MASQSQVPVVEKVVAPQGEGHFLKDRACYCYQSFSQCWNSAPRREGQVSSGMCVTGTLRSKTTVVCAETGCFVHALTGSFATVVAGHKHVDDSMPVDVTRACQATPCQRKLFTTQLTQTKIRRYVELIRHRPVDLFVVSPSTGMGDPPRQWKILAKVPNHMLHTHTQEQHSCTQSGCPGHTWHEESFMLPSGSPRNGGCCWTLKLIHGL